MIEKINQILKNQVGIAKRLDKIEAILLDWDDAKLIALEKDMVATKHHARIESLVKSMVLFPNSTSKYLDELRVELDLPKEQRVELDLPKEQLPWEGEDR